MSAPASGSVSAAKASPWWWELAEPTPADAPPPAKADVAVIGAGYCGLNAALRLARAGVAVAVLDAERPGWGASSRNGGMVSGGGKLPGTKDPGLDRALLAESVASFHYLEKLVADEGLERAQYARRGRFLAAHSPAKFEGLAKTVEQLREQAGFDARLVPPERMEEELDTPLHHGGMVVEDSGGLHPAGYHADLRRVVEAAGATLHGGCPATALERSGTGWRVTTPKGVVEADQVVIATNGYSGPIRPWLRRRLIPVASYMIATAPIPPQTMARLMPKQRMYADTRRVLSYFRPSPDGQRLLYGGRASFRDVDAAAAAPELHAMASRLFPEIASIPVTHAWKGNVAFSFDFLPHLARQDGVVMAAGCQSNGVAMMSFLGDRAAAAILDPSSEVTVFERTAFPTLPLYGGDPWFLPAVGSYYRLRDRMEIGAPRARKETA